MAFTPSHLLRLSSQPHPPSPSYTTLNFNCIFSDLNNITTSLSPPPPTTYCLPSLTAVHKSPLFSPTTALSVKCFTKSTDEDGLIESELNQARDKNESRIKHSVITNGSIAKKQVSTPSSGDSFLLGIREPIYEFLASGLGPRDIRSVAPSLFLTNSMPSLQVREHAILLNLASLRAIAMSESVLVFDYHRRGGQAFLDALLPRLNPYSNHGSPSMPFELEVVEAALLSRIQRLEKRLMALEPRVESLLEVLPNRLNGDLLEQLRISKQHLVELGSGAGALRQMLLDLLEDPHEIRSMCIMKRDWTLEKGNDDVERPVPTEQHFADEAEAEIEMLLENYLQRCESCYGQAERLLDSAREMEDSIAVNLSSRRLEVGRVELLLQVWAFCMSIGGFVTGIFGMNLKSYLEEHAFAFGLTTAGIIVGSVLSFFLMYSYLKRRKIL